jgi:hypothetical protein
LAVARRGGITGDIYQFLDGFPFHGPILKKTDGATGAKKLDRLLFVDQQFLPKGRTVFQEDARVAERPVGADGHAVAALNTGHFSPGNHFRQAILVPKTDDGQGTFVGAQSVFPAFIFIDLQETHIFFPLKSVAKQPLRFHLHAAKVYFS